MKKIIYIILLLGYLTFFTLGCTSMKDSLEDYNSCMQDPLCIAEVQKISQPIKDNGTDFFRSLAGMATALVLTFLYGRRKRKQDVIKN